MPKFESFIDKLALILSAFLLIALLVMNLKIQGEQQFTYLAESFLQGKTYFTEKPGSWNDTALYQGRYYWPLGPFPAVVLTPFVFISSLLGQNFHQGFLQIFLVILVFGLVFKIAKHFSYSDNDAFFLALAYCFASSFLGVALVPWSWYFAHVVSVLLSFLIIISYLKKKYLYVGVLTSLLLITRVFASLIIILPIASLIFLSKENQGRRLKNLGFIIIPYAITAVLLLVYNYVRFDNFFEQGNSLMLLPVFHAKSREYGLFSLLHIPGNLYYFLLSGPLMVLRDNVSRVLTFPFLKGNPWGMSIFLTSPYLISLFLYDYKDRLSKIILATSGIIALPIFLFHGIGMSQFGFRYSLDFLPLLYLILLMKYKIKRRSLSDRFKILIIVSIVFNFYLFFFSFPVELLHAK